MHTISFRDLHTFVERRVEYYRHESSPHFVHLEEIRKKLLTSSRSILDIEFYPIPLADLYENYTSDGMGEDVTPYSAFVLLRPKPAQNKYVVKILNDSTNRDFSDPRGRVALCKEICHIFDSPDQYASASDEVESLIDQVDTIPENGPSPARVSEDEALWRALILLVPRKWRDLYLEEYSADELTTRVSSDFRIPLDMAEKIVSEKYTKYFDLLISK